MGARVLPSLQTERRRGDASLRWLSLLGFLSLWQLAAATVSSDTLPGPWQVVLALRYHLMEQQLAFHFAMTLVRVGISFTIAMALGSALGIAMGSSRRVDEALDSLLVIALNVPALVTIVLCYLWFGLNEVAAIVAVAVNKIPTVVTTVREGARAVDVRLLEVAHAYGVPRHRRALQVYLPQLYPYLMAAARSGLALIWKIVLVVELLGRSNGVGFQISTFFQFFDISSILAYTAAFAGLVLAIEGGLLRPLERRVNRWRSP